MVQSSFVFLKSSPVFVFPSCLSSPLSLCRKCLGVTPVPGPADTSVNNHLISAAVQDTGPFFHLSAGSSSVSGGEHMRRLFCIFLLHDTIPHPTLPPSITYLVALLCALEHSPSTTWSRPACP